MLGFIRFICRCRTQSKKDQKVIHVPQIDAKDNSEKKKPLDPEASHDEDFIESNQPSKRSQTKETQQKYQNALSLKMLKPSYHNAKHRITEEASKQNSYSKKNTIFENEDEPFQMSSNNSIQVDDPKGDPMMHQINDIFDKNKKSQNAYINLEEQKKSEKPKRVQEPIVLE